MLRLRLVPGALIALTVSFAASDASARSFRVDNLPNGDAFGCRNCHNDDTGATMSPFGSDARNFLDSVQVQGANVAWAVELCNADSDGDGWTNGEELGDPDCTWTVGSPNPSGNVTNPGNASSGPPAVCGNGRLETGEDCDSGELRKPDCADIEAGEGSLACGEECAYDVSGCSGTPSETAGAGGGADVGDDGGASSGGCAFAPVGGHGSMGALGVLAGALAGAALGRRRTRR
jgi:hypothetical protein